MASHRRSLLWIRLALRDARGHGLQVASTGLLLAPGVGMYAAMSSMSWRVDSADGSFAALGMHDLRVSLVEGSTTRQGTLRAALTASGTQRDVAAASERLVLSTQVDASTRGRTIIVPGRIAAPQRARESTRSTCVPAGGPAAARSPGT